jgi:hypothetical protein
MTHGTPALFARIRYELAGSIFFHQVQATIAVGSQYR